MASFYKWYLARLTARPLLTQCISTGFLFGAGDLIAQVAEEATGDYKSYDLQRTARMVFHGGVVFAPIVTRWYGLVSRVVKIPGRPNLQAFGRMVVDQAVWAPVGIASFYVSMGVLQGHSWQSIEQDLRDKWYPTMVGNYAVWPLVQVINFRFMPLQHRLLFVNLVSIGWNAFLSWFSSN
ncbi:hypothetical protein V1514DRAFT_333102 [Lipomyces japonicus]|uniref:uncharacterized protein n=1 Tax=Lipomyces japonicus TaxID=56871 RepID=UPI0034CFF7AB